MSVSNIGAQQITFKYSTPLQAEYLNIMLSGSTSEGLCTRPKINVGSVANSKVDIVIKPFSLIVYPIDDDKTPGETLIPGGPTVEYKRRMVKITTQEDVPLEITDSTRAIGFRYYFRDKDSHQTLTQWYGDWEVLDEDKVSNYDGIIIATTIMHVSVQSSSCSVTTQGADISDFLLREEGWDCNRWVSLISPRRLGNGGKFDRLELRKHNEAFSGFINGHAGCVEQKDLTIPIDGGDSGYMGDGISNYTRYNLVKHNSEGLSWAQRSENLPIEKTDGGIVAVYDAKKPNDGAKMSVAGQMFSNLSTIYPCVREELNVYLDDETLMIR